MLDGRTAGINKSIPDNSPRCQTEVNVLEKTRKALDVQRNAIGVFRTTLNYIEPQTREATELLMQIETLYQEAIAEINGLASSNNRFHHDKAKLCTKIAGYTLCDAYSDGKCNFTGEPCR